MKSKRTIVLGAAGTLVTAALSGLLAGSAQATPLEGIASSSHSAAVMGLAGASAGTFDSDAGKHDCKGKNSCQGQGGCKSGDNGCKGKNSCKGKGGCNTNK